MPIAVRVVSDQAFNAWVEDAKKKFASAPDAAGGGAPQLAQKKAD